MTRRKTERLTPDELVTDRLLEPAAYARSLVQLAGAAIAVGRPTATISVGIGDADILEERVMAILSRPKISLRRKTLLLAAAALVFIVSCVVAAPFARHININSQEQEAQLKEELSRSARELEEGLRLGYKGWPQSETQGQEFDAKLLAQQLGIKAGREDELAKLPQITMQQAIQIATAQQPGKVLECRLAGRVVEDLWLAYYDVWILSAEGAERTFTRFAISAIDGRILGRINTSAYK